MWWPKALAGRLPADAALLARSGDMMSLIEDWAGFDALVCVDAAAPMGAPGRIHRIDLAMDELPTDMSFTSSHAFGLAETVRLARTLELAPQDIVVYAVEGCCFDGGAPMTADVAAAAGEVAASHHRRGRAPPAVPSRCRASCMKPGLFEIWCANWKRLRRRPAPSGYPALSVWLGALSHFSPEHFREHFDD